MRSARLWPAAAISRLIFRCNASAIGNPFAASAAGQAARDGLTGCAKASDAHPEAGLHFRVRAPHPAAATGTASRLWVASACPTTWSML